MAEIQAPDMNFTTYPFSIPAGATVPFSITSSRLALIEATDEINVIFGVGNKTVLFAGLTYGTPQGQAWGQIYLENPTGTTVTGRFIAGNGLIEDRRLTATGNLQVVNPAGQKLDVDDADTQTAIAATNTLLTTIDGVLDNIKSQTDNLSSILSRLGDIETMSTGAIDMTNASYGSAINSTTTLVTAVANTSGIIVFKGIINDGGSGTGSVKFGGNPIIGADFAGTATYRESLETPLLLPSGSALVVESTSANVKVHVWYEVL